MKSTAKEEKGKITRLPDDHEAAGSHDQKRKDTPATPETGTSSGSADHRSSRRPHSGSDGPGNMERGSNH